MNHLETMEFNAAMSFARNPRLAAYQSVSVHGGVADADPHRMVLMLLDAAVDRMATARGCMERGEIARKARLLHNCVNIVAELRGSLNLAEGGDLAKNLSDLYEYMIRRLLLANANSDIKCVNEVIALLDEIRGAWIAIGPEVHKSAQNGVPGSMVGTAAAPPVGGRGIAGR
jgi:flagellar protein FliS